MTKALDILLEIPNTSPVLFRETKTSTENHLPSFMASYPIFILLTDLLRAKPIISLMLQYWISTKENIEIMSVYSFNANNPLLSAAYNVAYRNHTSILPKASDTSRAQALEILKRHERDYKYSDKDLLNFPWEQGMVASIKAKRYVLSSRYRSSVLEKIITSMEGIQELWRVGQGDISRSPCITFVCETIYDALQRVKDGRAHQIYDLAEDSNTRVQAGLGSSFRKKEVFPEQVTAWEWLFEVFTKRYFYGATYEEEKFYTCFEYVIGLPGGDHFRKIISLFSNIQILLDGEYIAITAGLPLRDYIVRLADENKVISQSFYKAVRYQKDSAKKLTILKAPDENKRGTRLKMMEFLEINILEAEPDAVNVTMSREDFFKLSNYHEKSEILESLYNYIGRHNTGLKSFGSFLSEAKDLFTLLLQPFENLEAIMNLPAKLQKLDNDSRRLEKHKEFNLIIKKIISHFQPVFGKKYSPEAETTEEEVANFIDRCYRQHTGETKLSYSMKTKSTALQPQSSTLPARIKAHPLPLKRLIDEGGMPNGSLYDRLNIPTKLTWSECLQIGLDIAICAQKIHAMLLIHGDIKPENILFTKEFKALLADLGRSAMFGKFSPTHYGNKNFNAPELYDNDSKLTPACDIYSIGRVLLALNLHRPDFEETGPLYVTLEKNPAPRGYHTLIIDCCDTNPSKRPNAFELVARLQEIIKDYDNSMSSLADNLKRATEQASMPQSETALPSSQVKQKLPQDKIESEDKKLLPESQMPTEKLESEALSPKQIEREENIADKVRRLYEDIDFNNLPDKEQKEDLAKDYKQYIDRVKKYESLDDKEIADILFKIHYKRGYYDDIYIELLTDGLRESKMSKELISSKKEKYEKIYSKSSASSSCQISVTAVSSTLFPSNTILDHLITDNSSSNLTVPSLGHGS